MKQRGLAKLQRMQRSSLGFLLIRAGQLYNERGIARVNQEAGQPVLREAHTRLLPHLQDPNGIRITELAARIGVTKQAVQPLVSELAEAGVVTIEPDPEDARARLVVLSEHGIEAMLHGTRILHGIERELTRQVGRKDVATLKALLTRLLGALEGPS